MFGREGNLSEYLRLVDPALFLPVNDCNTQILYFLFVILSCFDSFLNKLRTVIDSTASYNTIVNYMAWKEIAQVL